MPSLTRRRALLGAGVLATGGAVATVRSGGPGGLVDRLFGDDSSSGLDWHPPVGEAVVAESHEALESRVERARRLWERVDAEVETLPDVADPAGEIYLGDAEDRLAELEGADPSLDAFLELRRAHGSANYAAAAARVALEEADPATIVARGATLRSDAASVADQIGYAVDDPATGLGWLYAIEERLLAARRGSYRGSAYDGETAAPETFDPVDVLDTRESQARAREDVRLAEHWLRSYRERRSDPDGVAMELSLVRQAYGEARRELSVPVDERQRRLAELGDGPYARARELLVRYTLRELEVTREALAPGLVAAQTIREARNVARLRAYRDAREAIEFEPGDEVSASLVRTAADRATDQLSATARAYPPPVATAALSPLAERVRGVEVGDGDSGAGGSGEEGQRQLVDAYVVSLAAEHQLRALETILAPFEGASIEPEAFE